LNMTIGGGASNTTARGTFKQALANQIWFDDVLDCGHFFTGCGRDGIKTDRAAIKFFDNYLKYSPVGGTQTKGITIGTRPGAQVVAPYDGQVVFSGPFRGYGPIVIIEHGGGYHSLLAGLHRIDTTDGSWVVAGEPVGIMDDGPEDTRRLYLELRRNGQPINPSPWIASREGKTSG